MSSLDPSERPIFRAAAVDRYINGAPNEAVPEAARLPRLAWLYASILVLAALGAAALAWLLQMVKPA